MVMKFDNQLFRNDLLKFMDRAIDESYWEVCPANGIMEKLNEFLKNYDFDSRLYFDSSEK